MTTSPETHTQSGLRYRPIIALGQGGMADVLLSVGQGPSGFNKLVVLKTMRKELATDEDMRQMFLAEARLSARLNHANVVQVYEVVDTALPCIIMEYLEGQPMSALLGEAGEQFTLPMQLKAISETLAGLHYSHELKDYDGTPLNIVHRDVSPQNIFITYDGVVKVLDFGIAKASNDTSQTRTGVVKGKITYMPREQLLGEHIDRRADVYAVGCMLWHAAAGMKLWSKMPDGEVMRALIDGNIPSPSEKRPVDPKLEEIVMKALASDAQDRYATALEMRLVVDQYVADNCPKTSLREVGELVAKVFADQNETRKKHIHIALTTPHSEPSPPIPDGIASIVQSAVKRTAPMSLLPRKKQMIWMVGAAAIAAVLSVGGMLAVLTWRGSHGDSAIASRTASPAQIHIRLAATPAGASLSVDGNPLNGDPALLTVPTDSNDHEIRATLAGYEPYLNRVRFERDLSLDIMLHPIAASDATSASLATSAEAKITTNAGSVAPLKDSHNHVAGAKKKNPNCDPPFYFERGIKVYKPGCL